MAVLVVEDDTIVRLTVCECLEDAGLDVLDAENAAAAVAILEKPPCRVTVLVTDLILGPGDNGLVLAARARRRLPRLRVVYATGSPEMLRGRQMRPWERLFTKPYDICRLRDEVAALDQALLGSMATLHA